ncbi:MAG: DUF5678 domain-containing protein [bacterium]
MPAKKLSPGGKFSSYMEDSDRAIANAQMLSENYGSQWIAVHHKKVVAHSEDLSEVVGYVRRFDIEEPVLTYIEWGFRVYKYSALLSGTPPSLFAGKGATI